MSTQNQPATGSAASAARIFVENFMGLITVYTDLPEPPELCIVDAVWDEPDEETLDNHAYLKELLERGEIRELPQTPNWILTDGDCYQCRRRITEKRYELIQVQDLGTEYGVMLGIIDLDDYTLDEWEDYLRPYGHDGLRDFIAAYGNTLPFGVLAECIFESEWKRYLLEKRHSKLEDAVQFIAGVVDCPLPDAGEEKAA